MKQNYPHYGRFGVEEIFKTFPQLERDTIEQFIAYCAITAGKRKQQDIKRSIIQFRDIVEKPFTDISLQDMRCFLVALNASDRKEYTRNGIKVHVRRFLKWCFKDWSQRFEEFGDIKWKNGFNEEKINEGTLLTKNQIESIIKKETDFIRKAFFIALYESGLRPKELRTLRWKNVDLDTDGGLSELHVFATKTNKARTVFVKDATFYLKRMFENRNSEYIFPSLEDADHPLPKGTDGRWIKEMGEAVGLKLFPYLLRHTRAHELYSKMPSKIAQRFMGHNSDMSELYAHISSKDIKDSILKTVYNFKELPHDTKHKLELEVEQLQRKIDVIYQNLPLISKIIAKNPPVAEVETALKKRTTN